MRSTPGTLAALVLLTSCQTGLAADGQTGLRPMRPLPAPSDRPLGDGPVRYVAVDGDDDHEGTRRRPWRSLRFALRQLEPGDTLCLRGGTYYEPLDVVVSGEPQRPVTIRSEPGELAIIDGGLPEFLDDPASAWMPLPDGHPLEYVSTRTYPQFSPRPVLSAFPAAGWEPFYGKEEQRPVVLGHFADSMVPLHGYRTRNDLCDDSMLWDVDNKFETDEGVYCGPGLWFDRGSERIHIRLAPTELPGLGERAYRGETDPRKLRLCISGPCGADVLRLNGVRHVVLQDLVLRGASSSPLIHLNGCDQITLDGVTAYGGSPGLLAKATSNLRIVHSAFRGLAAPWSSRSSMKYRGVPSYRLITQRAKPENHDWEIAFSEFSDDHDGIWLRYVRNLRFHHNLFDHFNDDGIELGARKADQLVLVYQNLISRCLLTFTLHEMDRNESPPEVDPGSGVYITRNLIDLRRGALRSPPRPGAEATHALEAQATLTGDHGGPTWPNYYFYHNTVLRTDPSWRGYYGFGMGGRATRGTQRRVFNNIFVQAAGMPGLNFAGGPDDVAVDGNLHWSLAEGPDFAGDFFARQPRGSAYRDRARSSGWMGADQFANPRLRQLAPDPDGPADIVLRPDSPAINTGAPVPDDWFDPLRDRDPDRPDIGAMPHPPVAWRVGIGGRLPVAAPMMDHQNMPPGAMLAA